jgi:gliding motility-associated-like protein
MSRRIRWVLYLVGSWLALLPLAGHASHIIGGNIVLRPKAGLKGMFTVGVVLYYDANSIDPNASQEEVTVSFFRKRDNLRQQDLRLKRVSKEPLVFSNPACARSRNLEIIVVEFAADVLLPSAQYNDPDGYYISWERCCLSSSVVNIQGAGTASMVLYAEFPPMQVPNSLPVFRPANGEILCRNTPYQFGSVATDADGDEIRYRLENPFNSTRPPYNIDPLAAATTGPYPRAQWSAGYGLGQVVPGNPALRLDASTGSISITPTQTGLFVYRVVAEEYRKGKKIGEVHRDFQLLVIDCPDENPTPVALTQTTFPPNTTFDENKEILEVSICRGESLYLEADKSPQWAYQWQRDGVNIENGNTPGLKIAQEGVYSVQKTFANRCGNARALGEKIRVLYREEPKPKLTPGPTASVCDGKALTLTAEGSRPDWRISWKKDGQTLLGATTAILSEVKLAGTYVIEVSSTASGCRSADTVQVSLNARPAATLLPAATEFCEGDSLRLQSNPAAGLTYAWYFNSAPLTTTLTPALHIRKGGDYVVEVTDLASGCASTSEPLRIKMNPVPEVLFDSIPVLCGQANARLSLTASPAGGVFSGKGITNSTFDARLAGTGMHLLTYRYTSPNGCARSATRVAQVVTAPRVQLASDKTILAGTSVQIRSSVTEGAIYSWSPPEGLDDPTVPQPTATPALTTTYRLRVSTANGCYNEAAITLNVLPLLTIPNGFTPNGDGTNDTWEIPDISAYPDCEVEIFNRWGSRVFRSVGYLKEWDGRYEGQELPAATYYYVIKLHSQLPSRSGSVSIFR